jgi:RNA polymerase sigma-70 factor (ECF subfamily)
MSRNTADLVRAAQQDDNRALEALCAEWLPVVLGWCMRLASPGVHAEDAAHDVFEVVLERLPSLRDPAAFPAWVFGVTRRVLAAHHRRAWFRKWIPGLSADDTSDGSLDPAALAAVSQTAVRVREALGTLSVDHREVLVLCDLEERSDSEVAELLGVPKNTVKSRLRRAREQLRASVGDLEEAEDLVASGGER